jgi:putative hydrolase of HD superfamily
MSLIAWTLGASNPEVDSHRVMKMCLVHDLAESLVGDITPLDNVSKDEKGRRESLTIDWITDRLLYGNTALAEEIRAVWREFEGGKTPESQLAQDIDKIELLLQMVEYEKREARDLSDFAYVARKLRLPESRKLADEILAGRPRLQGKEPITEPREGIRELQDQYYDG